MTDVALVTGASSGIGTELARVLAKRGYDLVLVARRRDRLEQLAAELGGTTHVVECDLTEEALDLPRLVSDLGVEVDLLVNNAGFGTWGRFVELDPQRELDQIRLNCEAVVALTRAFLPGMVERGRGGIITIASTAGMQPLPYEAVYAATKAFARSFTAALRAELRGTGVKVLAVNPGPVATEWQTVAGYPHPGHTFGVPGKIGPRQVAEETLAAFERDRGALIPGRVMRWFMRGGTFVPERLKVSRVERMYRPD